MPRRARRRTPELRGRRQKPGRRRRPRGEPELQNHCQLRLRGNATKSLRFPANRPQGRGRRENLSYRTVATCGCGAMRRKPQGPDGRAAPSIIWRFVETRARSARFVLPWLYRLRVVGPFGNAREIRGNSLLVRESAFSTFSATVCAQTVEPEFPGGLFAGIETFPAPFTVIRRDPSIRRRIRSQVLRWRERFTSEYQRRGQDRTARNLGLVILTKERCLARSIRPWDVPSIQSEPFANRGTQTVNYSCRNTSIREALMCSAP